jgi:hypothetical protein
VTGMEDLIGGDLTWTSSSISMSAHSCLMTG